MKQALRSSVSFFLQLTLFSFIFGAGNAFANPYDLDLSKTACLAKDIATGPVGWECKTSSGSFIITFFGVNGGAIGKYMLQKCQLHEQPVTDVRFGRSI